jgi:hypothetical protein
MKECSTDSNIYSYILVVLVIEQLIMWKSDLITI